MSSGLKASIKKATSGHTDLTVFHMIINVLEGGGLYDAGSHAAAEKIIRICKTEAARLLRLHDRGVAEIMRQALKEPTNTTEETK